MEALIQNVFTTRSQLIGAYIYKLIAGYMVFLWFQGHEYMIFFYLEATNFKFSTVYLRNKKIMVSRTL